MKLFFFFYVREVFSLKYTLSFFFISVTMTSIFLAFTFNPFVFKMHCCRQHVVGYGFFYLNHLWFLIEIIRSVTFNVAVYVVMFKSIFLPHLFFVPFFLFLPYFWILFYLLCWLIRYNLVLFI